MPQLSDLIVHEDPRFIVLRKPAGLLSVPGRGEDKQDCLSARVQAVYPEALIVHRLDMATSGLIVMARDIEAQRELSNAFASRETRKEYVAVVHGIVENDEGSIDLPIAADWPNRPLRVIDHANGKPSVTHWKIESTSGSDEATPRTRLMLMPITGRTHQLRLHLQALGHPIVGDALYGNSEMDEAVGASRLLLHAARLSFACPSSGKELSFADKPPF